MWVVDPIDGTTNFLRGFPVVGVSVALVEEGRPVVGAVNAPLLGASWSAAEGLGATDETGRPLSVSTHPGAGVVATGFPFRRKERLPRYLDVFGRALTRFEDLRRAGAASLDLAYVGAGVFDGFFELGLGDLGHRGGSPAGARGRPAWSPTGVAIPTMCSSAATSWRAPVRGMRRCSRSSPRNCAAPSEPYKVRRL